jgi:hypothetical protein
VKVSYGGAEENAAVRLRKNQRGGRRGGAAGR